MNKAFSGLNFLSIFFNAWKNPLKSDRLIRGFEK